MSGLSGPMNSTPILSSTFTTLQRPALHNLIAVKRSYTGGRRRRTISCKGNDDKPTRSGGLDRRDVLTGLGGLYAAGLATVHPALGLPIDAPDVNKCVPVKDILPDSNGSQNCCPPVADIIDFTFPSPYSPLRVRPAAHAVTPEYLAKFTRAMEIMRGLKDDDPLSFTQQAKVHCAYCDAAYQQAPPNSDKELQIHSCWLFFPWHRMYLYFFERILGKLIGDDTFAIPFWNWDNPLGMTLPLMYNDSSSPLYATGRYPENQPPTIVDLISLRHPNTPLLPPDQQIIANLKQVRHAIVEAGDTAEHFMGSAYPAGTDPNPGQGTMEASPHSPVHVWSGTKMSKLYTAAFDPVFYAHHANIDRLWDVWRGLGGKRANFTDPDWLDSNFIFYDENRQLVRIKVKDVLEADALRYSYARVDNPWLYVKSVSAKKSSKFSDLKKKPAVVETKFPVTLGDAPVSVTVRRPKVARSAKEKEEEVEELVVEGIEADRTIPVKFDVFVNAPPDLEGVTPAEREYAGSFANLPHHPGLGKGHGTIKTTLKLGITSLLEDLDCEKDDSVVITLVARAGVGKIKVGGVSIKLVK